MCVMQSKNLKKIDKIVLNISENERKIFMEMLQREETCELKGNRH
jgi:hypothetical protein